MPLRSSVRQLISARAVCALLLVAAITANVNPVHAQWDRDGYFTGGDGERDEPRDKRRPRPPRTPSDSYDFGGINAATKSAASRTYRTSTKHSLTAARG